MPRWLMHVECCLHLRDICMSCQRDPGACLAVDKQARQAGTKARLDNG